MMIRKVKKDKFNQRVNKKKKIKIRKLKKVYKNRLYLIPKKLKKRLKSIKKE